MKFRTSIGLPGSYELRKGQAEFIQEASKAVKNREVFVGSAPCGIGKSIASLVAVLPQLGDNRLMICFRTRSQLHIYLKELRALSSDLCCVSFFSKQDMCPLKTKDDASYLDFFEECRRRKENCELSTRPFCRFFKKNIEREEEAEQLALECGRRILAPEESVEFMSKRGFCAHEALKTILPRANIFLGTYHYAFDPGIRESILKSFGPGFSKVFLIVDEAHNLPNFARGLLSDELTEVTVERALRETEAFEHESRPVVKEHLQFLMKEIFERGQTTLGPEELRLLNLQEVSDLFLASRGVSAEEVADTLKEYGQHVKNEQLKSGSMKLSNYNLRIGLFIENFFKYADPKHVHLILRDRRNRIALSVKSLDGREIVDIVLREARGSILMSGFLSPPTVYRDLMLYNPERTCLKEFDSPFPSENRLILAAEDVSSEFKKRSDVMLRKWKDYIEAISHATEGNLAVFFTSYGLMREVTSLVKTNRRTMLEGQDTVRSEVIDRLRSSSRNILYGVMGAKLSEGMDYPGNILKCVITVGLPLATWNPYESALIDYLEQQFPGRGRTYAYYAPAILRLVQACGRVHRSARDKGCIVMLDNRVSQPYVKRQLPSYYQKEMVPVNGPSECGELIEKFWNSTRGARKT
ncbi:MAG: ATP-dependent DNA helicase [Candidatus Bathyarchaeia archaeon]|jgi:DNA excision repair protein ERCC-2